MPRRSALALAWLALVLTVLVQLRGAWDLHFYSDDFEHLARVSRSTAWQLFDHDVLGLARYHEQTETTYWRPGWYLLFRLGYVLFGLAPAGYVALQLGLHVAVLTGVLLAVARRTASAPLGLAAALAFASVPAYAEGVLWPSASFNVLPAALCMLAAGLAYLRYLETGARRPLLLAALAFLAAFLFKEAAYCFPALVALGHLILEPERPLAARARRGALHALPFGLVVLAHYRFLNWVAVDSTALGDRLTSVPTFAATYLRALTGLDLATAPLLALAALAGALLFWKARPPARYLLAWAVLASFPYVIANAGSRFQYFVYPPLAIAAGLLGAQLAARTRTSPRALGLAVAGLAAVLGLLRWPPHVLEHVVLGQAAERALAASRDQGLDGLDVVYVEREPRPLANGFAPLLELHLAQPPRVVDLGARRRPPLFVVAAPEFWDAAPDATYLRPNGLAFDALDRAALLDGLIPIPAFGFVESFEVVPSRAALLARATTVDLSRTALLERAPALALGPTADHHAERRAYSSQTTEYTLEVATPALFVCYTGRPLEELEVLVDGAPAEALAANALGLALPLEPGRYVLVVKAPAD